MPRKWRALLNVIKNAVAYADPDSTILIDAHAKPDGAFKIEVTNQGREISPGHLKRIFEKFYREDDARATRQGGGGPRFGDCARDRRGP